MKGRRILLVFTGADGPGGRRKLTVVLDNGGNHMVQSRAERLHARVCVCVFTPMRV